MRQWQVDYHRGVRALARHDPREAMQHFRMALESCPISDSQSLSRVLFFLGVALRRMNLSNCAVKSWISCQRLVKRGRTTRLVSRFINHYGMNKQSTEALDDWNAFYALHVSRYLNQRNRRSFGSEAEYAMVRHVILDAWRSLERSGTLKRLSWEVKSRVFAATRIAFPAAVAGESAAQPIINVNFAAKKRIAPGDRCVCGSGRAFTECCGRTPGVDEIGSGVF